MNPFEQLDYGLLFLINGNHTAWSDVFFYDVSQKYCCVPIILMLLFYLIRNKRNVVDVVVPVLLAVVIVALADQITSSLLKPLVARPRPSHDPLSMYLLHYVNDYHGGFHGFPSSHAANTFGIAVYFSLLCRKRWVTMTLFTWTIVVSYSRIYLGVHFPSDIVVGMVIGAAIGYSVYRLSILPYREYFSISNRYIRDLIAYS